MIHRAPFRQYFSTHLCEIDTMMSSKFKAQKQKIVILLNAFILNKGKKNKAENSTGSSDEPQLDQGCYFFSFRPTHVKYSFPRSDNVIRKAHLIEQYNRTRCRRPGPIPPSINSRLDFSSFRDKMAIYHALHYFTNVDMGIYNRLSRC